MTDVSRFRESLSWWALGFIDSTRLQAVAASGLEEGVDSPALRALAGLEASESAQAVTFLKQAATELNLRWPGKRDAAQHLAQVLSLTMVNGELDPLEGARKLSEISRAVDLAGFHDLDAFVYADSEVEDRPEDRDLFVESILSEARRWAHR